MNRKEGLTSAIIPGKEGRWGRHRAGTRGNRDLDGGERDPERRERPEWKKTKHNKTKKELQGQKERRGKKTAAGAAADGWTVLKGNWMGSQLPEREEKFWEVDPWEHGRAML